MDECEGRLVKKYFAVQKKGKAVQMPFWGVATYLGGNVGQQCYGVVYEDSTQQTMTRATLEKYLQPEGTLWPGTPGGGSVPMPPAWCKQS